MTRPRVSLSAPFPAMTIASTENPFLSGIPTLPDNCDAISPSQECFQSLDQAPEANRQLHTGAYLRLEKNHCCNVFQIDTLMQSFWEAADLLDFAAQWPDMDGSSQNQLRAVWAGGYWFWPDWYNFEDGIAGNIKRASGFVNAADNKGSYITVSCRDPKPKCEEDKGTNVTIGGYVWNEDHLAWTYGFINMCPTFYKFSNNADKEAEILGYIDGRQDDKVRNMDYYMTIAQFIFHKMFHLKSTYGSKPYIRDQYVGDPGDAGKDRAYTAFNARRLAKLKPGKDGGAATSFKNADSYAIMVNNLYWWFLNGRMIEAIDPAKISAATDLPVDPIFVILDLDNSTSASDPKVDSLFQDVINSYSNTGFDDSDGDEGVGGLSNPVLSTSITADASIPSPTSSPAPTATAADICGTWHEITDDSFKIYGKAFDTSKLGQDGSGFFDSLRQCGFVSGWPFSPLQNDPQGMEWLATGRLPIGTKSCVGTTLVRAGGTSADGCVGAG